MTKAKPSRTEAEAPLLYGLWAFQKEAVDRALYIMGARPYSTEFLLIVIVP